MILRLCLLIALVGCATEMPKQAPESELNPVSASEEPAVPAPSGSIGETTPSDSQAGTQEQKPTELQSTVPVPTPSNPVAEEPQIKPALPFGNAEFASDEEVLGRGQTLIDEGKFADAIQIFQTIGEESLFSATAKEKIREASNIAVQDLRTQAARAFQSSVAVADPRSKAGYLEEARKLLQTALEQFPSAEQIPTVRQNLEVIARNLQSLGR